MSSFILIVCFLLSLFGDSVSQNLDCGLTNHFNTFLNKNGYATWDFGRQDLNCGAFGGLQGKNDNIVKTPTIFIHGANDIGLGTGDPLSLQNGWRSLITYLSGQGYKSSEMYVTTWGKANPLDLL